MPKRFQQAFSLIELLTVIAIIAVLAAILVPVFARVRENTRKTQCMSNMHEIYVKVHLYEQDNGKYPDVLLAPYQPGTPAGSVNGPLYRTYIKSIDTFHCPDNTVVDQNTPANAYMPINGTPAASGAYYAYDSYDITSFMTLPDGKRRNNDFAVAYAKDWTGTSGTADAPYQMKYTRTVPLDKTLLTMCNYHVTTAGANMCPIILLSGTAKTVDFKQLINNPWLIATR